MAELQSLRAAVVSLRADLEAEAARRARDQAEAELQIASVVTDISETIRSDGVRYEVHMQMLEADTGAQLALVRAAHDENAAKWKVALDGVVHDVAEQTKKRDAEQAEQDSGLRLVNERVATLADEVSEALKVSAAEHANSAQSLRDDLEAAVAARSDALAAGIAAASTAHTTALRDRSRELAARIDRLDGVAVDHSARLEAASVEQAALGAELARQAKAADGRIAKVQAAIGDLDNQISLASARIDAAVEARSRIEDLAASFDALHERLSAAELALRQNDRTDIDLQLDRMESFERHLAEANPDLFAAKVELDVLRVRLSEIEAHVREAAES